MESLIKALRDAPPALFVTDLSSHVSKKTNIRPEQTSAIVSMLTGLYSARGERNIRSFVSELTQAIKTLDKTGKPNEVNWQQFKKDLAQLLSFDRSLGVTSKALDVMTEHENVFQNARILTDIRPVFGKNITKKPAAAVTIHTLQISYEQSGSLKEFYVAMDSRDVRILQAVLQRAIMKEISLKVLIHRSSVPYLEVKAE
jgi:hypothetical protein